MNPHRGFRQMTGEATWAELLGLGRPHRFPPRAELVRQGGCDDFLFAVTEGRIKVLHRDEDGEQLLMAVRGPGDLVGELARTGSTPRSATVLAVDPCFAHRIGSTEFDRFVSRHGLTGKVLDYSYGKLRESVANRTRLVHARPGARIARLLADTLDLAGPRLADPRRLPFTQQELATDLGLSRSKVATVIAELRSTGVLGRGPRLRVADPVRLRERANRSCHDPDDL
ncbi:Crp/Fnr family transcriptional regulator [Crossiella sp. CA198]|uniref:Crp/Fnr family transcriptional regulator n=1 Tax=Crossiella sp. CA198 TaxID=3455607 RepID=UPI003F8D4014